MAQAVGEFGNEIVIKLLEVGREDGRVRESPHVEQAVVEGIGEAPVGGDPPSCSADRLRGPGSREEVPVKIGREVDRDLVNDLRKGKDDAARAALSASGRPSPSSLATC